MLLFVIVPQQDGSRMKSNTAINFVIKKLSVELTKVFIVDLHPGASSFSHCGLVTKNSQTGATLGTRY